MLGVSGTTIGTGGGRSTTSWGKKGKIAKKTMALENSGTELLSDSEVESDVEKEGEGGSSGQKELGMYHLVIFLLSYYAVFVVVIASYRNFANFMLMLMTLTTYLSFRLLLLYVDLITAPLVSHDAAIRMPEGALPQYAVLGKVIAVQ